MTFDEVLTQVKALLQQEQRVSYRGLKRRFALDDEYLEDLKEELIGAKRLATDEDGRFLVWMGGTAVPSEQVPGASPSPSTPSSQSPEARPHPLDTRRSEGERRQLTVMFCDLVGSTALSAQLDPEELREVVRAYQETCTEVIRRYEGHIAQHLGDGLLVYFGYPAAHEDDAQRAVRASLEIIEALHHLNPHLSHPLQVRIGIHTGLVVVGEIGSSTKREILALGETPNLAARLQGLAEPDTVVISEATSHLVQGLFTCWALESQEVKGFPTPLTVYRVLGASGAQSRFEAAARTGLTPLVGREHEVGLLVERWERAQNGEGQVVLLSGEPGIGKSRLVQELKEQVAQDGALRIEFHCSPYHQNSALYPVIDHLQRLLQFNREDSPEQKLTKLEAVLESYGLAIPEVVPLLAALLSIPLSERYPPLTLTPQQQKQQTHEALLAWLLKEIERQPLRLVMEDLHWVDPSTLELLGTLIGQAPTTRMLLVLTFRPEFSPPWPSHSHVTPLTLGRLARKQVEAMVEKVTRGKGLPVEVVQQVVSKTDGVPLFVEELTKTVLESGLLRETNGHYELTSPLPPLAIPATLRDSLMARLDRLATVREVAQLGATLGREFPYELLRAVWPLDETMLQTELARLVEAELLYQRGLPPQMKYIFKHALLQEETYQSVLKSKRQQYHQRIAQALEERFPGTVETQPELVAHHYTEAGLIAPAILYWQRAGQRALQRSANIEAIHHLTKGVELLTTLPETPERAQQELALQTALGPVLIVTKGNAALEVERTYARARELCQQLGETVQLFPVLFGLRSCYLARADLQTAHEIGEQLLRAAQSSQDSDLLIEAYVAQGNTAFWLGEFVPAREYLEQGIAIYDPQQHRSHIFLYGLEPGVLGICRLATVLWLLGYPDQGLQRVHEALTLAQELSHPFTLVYVLANVASLHHLHREMQVTQEWAEQVITLSTEQGFPFFLGWGVVHRGWALAEQGREEEGIAQIRQGLAASRATGAESIRPYCLSLLAGVYEKTGQVEEGLMVLAEALEAVGRTRGRMWEAELYRLKGTLTLQSPVPSPYPPTPIPNLHAEAEAEVCFRKAIAIARRQQAKSWELRAVVSLSRLWQSQGKKKDEARRLLAEIYGWFTEGFDTKDLQDAKSLLDELS